MVRFGELCTWEMPEAARPQAELWESLGLGDCGCGGRVSGDSRRGPRDRYPWAMATCEWLHS